MWGGGRDYNPVLELSCQTKYRLKTDVNIASDKIDTIPAAPLAGRRMDGTVSDNYRIRKSIYLHEVH